LTTNSYFTSLSVLYGNVILSLATNSYTYISSLISFPSTSSSCILIPHCLKSSSAFI
jgi:hypothetical protein